MMSNLLFEEISKFSTVFCFFLNKFWATANIPYACICYKHCQKRPMSNVTLPFKFKVYVYFIFRKIHEILPLTGLQL